VKGVGSPVDGVVVANTDDNHDAEYLVGRS
jgi:hypothetical protein